MCHCNDCILIDGAHANGESRAKNPSLQKEPSPLQRQTHKDTNIFQMLQNCWMMASQPKLLLDNGEMVVWVRVLEREGVGGNVRPHP